MCPVLGMIKTNFSKQITSEFNHSLKSADLNQTYIDEYINSKKTKNYSIDRRWEKAQSKTRVGIEED